MGVGAENIDLFHREAASIKEVFDAKIDGVYVAIDGIQRVLERLTTTVEKQNEQNVQLAVVTNTVAHVQAMFIEHKMAADERDADINRRLADIDKRLTAKVAVDKATALKEGAKTAGFAAAVSGAVTFLTAQFPTILKLLGVG